eukprot:CAMPEP_0179148798 /NCGR_PEP_ID=MMETSP0796-20121207/72036_1 /TAXON_ID=73915 /ORGANISM="Pyrodinium bahamense, Strain pbaha01" /LENGTH=108 /DNA_ID=CAMNT_0020849561 /DNA_START=1 /DNA_END=325 /DNA_ORIENTATION=+
MLAPQWTLDRNREAYDPEALVGRRSGDLVALREAPRGAALYLVGHGALRELVRRREWSRAAAAPLVSSGAALLPPGPLPSRSAAGRAACAPAATGRPLNRRGLRAARA